jgi:hypothetical protein
MITIYDNSMDILFMDAKNKDVTPRYEVAVKNLRFFCADSYGEIGRKLAEMGLNGNVREIQDAIKYPTVIKCDGEQEKKDAILYSDIKIMIGKFLQHSNPVCEYIGNQMRLQREIHDNERR